MPGKRMFIDNDLLAFQYIHGQWKTGGVQGLKKIAGRIFWLRNAEFYITK